MRRRILSLGQHLMVAVGPGRRSYELLARALARYLRRGRPEVAVYLRGGLARGEVTPGLSDVDLLVVAPPGSSDPGARRRKLRERWRRLGALPPLRKIAGAVVYEQDVLHEVVREDALVFGLDRAEALYCGPGRPVPDDIGLSYRPGLHGTSEWRLLAGPDRRPAAAGDAESGLRAAWMEVQLCWRYVFEALVPGSDMSERYRSYLLPKITSDLARVWLWVARGQRPATRAAAVTAAADALEREHDELVRVRELLSAPRGSSHDVAREVLPLILRLTSLVARELSARAAEAGSIDVRLLGAAPGLQLPLVDWRAVAVPHPPEQIILTDGDPSDPSVLSAHFSDAGPYRGLRDGDLVVMPTAWTRALLRGVTFGATDPVTSALVQGSRTAKFSLVAGWSAHHWALRGVAEYRAWIEAGGARRADSGRSLALLLNAARPALLLETLEQGEGELALTARDAAERLAELRPEIGEPLVIACDELEGHLRPPVVAAAEAALRALPSYSASAAPTAAG